MDDDRTTAAGGSNTAGGGPGAAERFVGDALARLAAAVADRGSPLRNLALATVGPDGAPDARTVVLRDCTLDPPAIAVWSDVRADKVASIARDGRVLLLGWSEPDQLQLRLAGTAVLHHGDTDARAAWDAMPDGGRRAYGLDAAPGTPIAAPDTVGGPDPAARFGAFVLIAIAIARVDVLRLGPHGAQTRARRIIGRPAEWVAP